MRRIWRFSPCVSTMRNVFLATLLHATGIRDGIEDRHARRHAGEKRVRQRPIDGDEVFLLVLVLGAQDRG